MCVYILYIIIIIIIVTITIIVTIFYFFKTLLFSLGIPQGPWTDPSVFYWVDGETLDAEWPGWGGYGSAEGVFEIPVKQPHWEAFLDGVLAIAIRNKDATRGSWTY